MPDNPQSAAPRDHADRFSLPDHRVLALSGRDAVAFAQAQFMNDVVALGDGQWQWNGWLTPKGRVLALFALLRRDAGTLWLVLPDALPDADALAAQLRRFVFRSKVDISVAEGLHVTGAFVPPARASGAEAALAGEEAELDFGGEGGARTLSIGHQGAPEHPAALARWRAYDLRHGLPRLPHGEEAGQWTPQMLSLERLRAFSVKKGCYPGQEIVARTHFLGQAKRGLVLLEADRPLHPGAQVTDDGQVLGTLACVADDAGQHLALAVMPREHAPSALDVDGTAARACPLREGLAR